MSAYGDGRSDSGKRSLGKWAGAAKSSVKRVKDMGRRRNDLMGCPIEIVPLAEAERSNAFDVLRNSSLSSATELGAQPSSAYKEEGVPFRQQQQQQLYIHTDSAYIARKVSPVSQSASSARHGDARSAHMTMTSPAVALTDERYPKTTPSTMQGPGTNSSSSLTASSCSLPARQRTKSNTLRSKFQQGLALAKASKGRSAQVIDTESKVDSARRGTDSMRVPLPRNNSVNAASLSHHFPNPGDDSAGMDIYSTASGRLAPPQPAFLRNSLRPRLSQQSLRHSTDQRSITSASSITPPSSLFSSDTATAATTQIAAEAALSIRAVKADTYGKDFGLTRGNDTAQGRGESMSWRSLKKRLTIVLSASSKANEKGNEAGACLLQSPAPNTEAALVDEERVAEVPMPQLPSFSRRSTFELDSYISKSMADASRQRKQSGAPMSSPGQHCTNQVSAVTQVSSKENTVHGDPPSPEREVQSNDADGDTESHDSSEDDYGNDGEMQSMQKSAVAQKFAPATARELETLPTMSYQATLGDIFASTSAHDVTMDLASSTSESGNSTPAPSSPSVLTKQLPEASSVQVPKHSFLPDREVANEDYSMARDAVYACIVKKLFPALAHTNSATDSQWRGASLKQPRSMNKAADLAAEVKSTAAARSLRITLASARAAQRLQRHSFTAEDYKETKPLSTKHAEGAKAILEASKQNDPVAQALQASLGCFTITGKEAKARPPLGQSMGLWLSRPPFAMRVQNIVSADIAASGNANASIERRWSDSMRKVKPQPLQFSNRCKALAVMGSGVQLPQKTMVRQAPMRASTSITVKRRSATISFAGSVKSSPRINTSFVTEAKSSLTNIATQKMRLLETRGNDDHGESSEDDLPLAILSAKLSNRGSPNGKESSAKDKRLLEQEQQQQQQLRRQLEQKQKALERQLAENKKLLAEARARRSRTQHSAVLASPTYGAGDPLVDPRRTRRDKQSLSLHSESPTKTSMSFYGARPPLPSSPSASSVIDVRPRHSEPKLRHASASPRKEKPEWVRYPDPRQAEQTRASSTSPSAYATMRATVPKQSSPLASSTPIAALQAETPKRRHEEAWRRTASTVMDASKGRRKSAAITAPEPVYDQSRPHMPAKPSALTRLSIPAPFRDVTGTENTRSGRSSMHASADFSSSSAAEKDRNRTLYSPQWARWTPGSNLAPPLLG